MVRVNRENGNAFCPSVFTQLPFCFASRFEMPVKGLFLAVWRTCFYYMPPTPYPGEGEVSPEGISVDEYMSTRAFYTTKRFQRTSGFRSHLKAGTVVSCNEWSCGDGSHMSDKNEAFSCPAQ